MPVRMNVSRFNKHQRSILEKSFAVFRYLNRSTLNELILLTGLEEKQVSAWFSSKRCRTGMLIIAAVYLPRIRSNLID